MPVGKIKTPEGPNAQATLGTVEETNGKTYFILNNANLKKDEPVIFDISAYDLDIDGHKVKIKIATLEKNEKGIPCISEKPWCKAFKEKWDREWGQVNETRIRNMNIKRKGKPIDKRNIIEMWDKMSERIDQKK